MLKGEEVWVQGYIEIEGRKIDVSTSATLLEDVIKRRNTVLVRLDKFNGEHNVEKRVLTKFVKGL